MGLTRLNNLYRQVILDHAQHPRNKQLLDDYSEQIELLNPTCGDAITIRFKLEADKISAIGFVGSGCSISMASASMMTEAVKGKTHQEAMALIRGFNYLVGGTQVAPIDEESLGDASLLEGVKQFPARYKCAVLAWRALELGLDNAIELEEGLTMGQASEKESE